MAANIDTGWCRSGLHEMTAENTYTYPNGRRKCRACARVRDNRRHARHRNQRNAAKRETWSRYRDYSRQQLLAKKYGLDECGYAELLALQDGRCAICRTDQPGGRWNTHYAVDHDHLTGQVRGLLCHHCNFMLGNAADDPARLRAAADYLERFS